MPYMSIDGLLQGFEAYNEVIRVVARDKGALLIGDPDGIPADSVHYVDSAHFTDAGSRAMARRVTAALVGSVDFVKLIDAKMQAAKPAVSGKD